MNDNSLPSNPASPPSTSRPYLRWLVFAGAAAGVAALFLWRTGDDGGAGGGRGGPRETTVSAETVVRGTLTEQATYPGELSADAADVAANITGRLETVLVRIGDRVTAGQEIARVDARDLSKQRAEAKAQSDAAAAAEARTVVEVEASERELERARGLVAQRVISQQELDNQEARTRAMAVSVQVASAQAAQARARVQLLDQRIADSRIRAPFAGLVTSRFHDPGSFVATGATLIRLVADGPLRVRFEVPEQDVGLFVADREFMVRAPPTKEREVTGRVTGVGAEVDRERRVVEVEGVVAERPPSWLPGMYAEVVTVRRSLEDATIVPAVALVTRLVDESRVATGVFEPRDGVAHWIPVEVVARDGERAAVVGELAVGTRVLVGGHTDLADGAPIALAAEALR